MGKNPNFSKFLFFLCFFNFWYFFENFQYQAIDYSLFYFSSVAFFKNLISSSDASDLFSMVRIIHITGFKKVVSQN
jgi:hypothetical protein